MRLYFDTHAHYDDPRYDADRDALLASLHAAGVAHVLNVTSDAASLEASPAIAERFDFVWSAAGIHPHEAKNFDAALRDRVDALCRHPKVRTVGEIGLDYYYGHTEREEQKRCFADQLAIARAHRLPVIVHDREAHKDCLDVLAAERGGESGGVFHCYSGSVEMARELLGRGFHISFTGNVTFPKARRVHEAVAYVPIDRIMIETDCPYLSPEPFRGQRNDSGRLRWIAAAVAGIKGMDVDACERILLETSRAFFGVPAI
jgi:TatD DNase family protein